MKNKRIFINNILKEDFKYLIMNVSLLIFCMIVFFLPVFIHGSWVGNDTVFHMDRLLSTNFMIKTGQFPPLFDYENNFYYGNTWNLFYPPLSLFSLDGFFYLSGGSVNAAIKLTTVLIVALTLLTSGYAAKVIGLKGEARWVAPLFYSFCPYMATDLFVRFEFPEAFGLIFIPLFFAGLVTLKEKGRGGMLGASMGLIMLSNLPMFFCALFFLCVYVIFFSMNFVVIKNIVFKSVPLAVGLSSFYFIPFMYAYLTNSPHQKILSQNGFFQTMINYGLSAQDTFFLNPTKELGMGVPIGFLFILYIIYSVLNKRKINNYILCSMCFLVAVCGFIPFELFPDKLNILSIPQFSWRYLGIISFAFVFFILKEMPFRKKHLMGFLLVSVLFSSEVSRHAVSNRKDANEYISTQYALAKKTIVDYVPAGAVNVPMASDTIKSSHCTLKNHGISSHGFPFYNISCVAGDIVTLPVLSYSVIAPVSLGIPYIRKDGRFVFTVPSGEQTITFRYSRRFLIIVYSGFSVFGLTLLVMLYNLIRSRRVRVSQA